MNRDGQPHIARISVARYLTQAQMEAELAWLGLLAGRGLTVSSPVLSLRPRLYEHRRIDRIDYFLSVFTKAPGRKPERADLTKTFAHRLGELIGKLHATAAWANASGMSFARENWKESRLLTHDLVTTSAPIGSRFRDSMHELVGRIDALAVTPTTFGLIHGDVNSGNCHIENEQVWLFDFDNCEHGYFVQDLAVMLYDTLYSAFVKHVPAETLVATILNLWQPLVTGYRVSGPRLTLGADDLRNRFLLREAALYIHYHRVFPAARLVKDDYVTGMRTRVASLSHSLDFAALADV